MIITIIIITFIITFSIIVIVLILILTKRLTGVETKFFSTHQQQKKSISPKNFTGPK